MLIYFSIRDLESTCHMSNLKNTQPVGSIVRLQYRRAEEGEISRFRRWAGDLREGASPKSIPRYLEDHPMTDVSGY